MNVCPSRQPRCPNDDACLVCTRQRPEPRHRPARSSPQQRATKRRILLRVCQTLQAAFSPAHAQKRTAGHVRRPISPGTGPALTGLATFRRRDINRSRTLLLLLVPASADCPRSHVLNCERSGRARSPQASVLLAVLLPPLLRKGRVVPEKCAIETAPCPAISVLSHATPHPRT